MKKYRVEQQKLFIASVSRFKNAGFVDISMSISGRYESRHVCIDPFVYIFWSSQKFIWILKKRGWWPDNFFYAKATLVWYICIYRKSKTSNISETIYQFVHKCVSRLCTVQNHILIISCFLSTVFQKKCQYISVIVRIINFVGESLQWISQKAFFRCLLVQSFLFFN